MNKKEQKNNVALEFNKDEIIAIIPLLDLTLMDYVLKMQKKDGYYALLESITEKFHKGLFKMIN